MPDLMDRVFADETIQSGPEPDLMDRIFSADDPKLEIPADSKEADQLLGEVVDLSDKWELTLEQAEAEYGRRQKIAAGISELEGAEFKPVILPPIRENLAGRGLKALGRSFTNVLQAVQTKSTLGELDTLLELSRLTEDFEKTNGREATIAEYTAMQQRARSNVRARVAQKYEGLESPKASTTGEKAVDIAGGLVGFFAKLAITKKAIGLPPGSTAGNVVAFEALNQVEGGTPGAGAGMALMFGAMGKIPAVTTMGKAGRLAAEMGVFAGMAAAGGGDTEDIVIQALIPVVFGAMRAGSGRISDAKLVEDIRREVPWTRDIPRPATIRFARAMRAAREIADPRNPTAVKEYMAKGWEKQYGDVVDVFLKKASAAHAKNSWPTARLPAPTREPAGVLTNEVIESITRLRRQPTETKDKYRARIRAEQERFEQAVAGMDAELEAIQRGAIAEAGKSASGGLTPVRRQQTEERLGKMFGVPAGQKPARAGTEQAGQVSGKEKQKEVYTSTPEEWTKETELWDWGQKKGLRARGNKKIGKRKSLPNRNEYVEIPVRLPRSTYDAFRERTGEVFKVHNKRGADYYIVPRQLYEQVKAELPPEAFYPRGAVQRAPKQRINDSINSMLQRGDLYDHEIGQWILKALPDYGLTEGDLTANMNRYVNAWRLYDENEQAKRQGEISGQSEAGEVRGRLQPGVGEEVPYDARDELTKREGVQSESKFTAEDEQLVEFLERIIEIEYPEKTARAMTAAEIDAELEAQAEAEVLAEELAEAQAAAREILRANGIDAPIEIVGDIEGQGQLFEREEGRPVGAAVTTGAEQIIYLALGADSRTGYHEGYHILRPRLTEPDRKVLEEEFGGDEEAEAAAFADYMHGVKTSSRLRKIWATLKAVLERIRRALFARGLRTPEDVFGDIRTGKLRKTPVAAEQLSGKEKFEAPAERLKRAAEHRARIRARKAKLRAERAAGRTPKTVAKGAIARASDAGGKIKDLGKSAGEMFMDIFEPARAVAKKHGRRVYADVIRAIHEPEAKKLDFDQTDLEAMDQTISQLREWMGTFPEADQFNFTIAFAGQPETPVAAAEQQAAYDMLPDELKDPKLIEAVREISERNFRYLMDAADGKIGYVKDYFYGVWADPDAVDRFLAFWKTTERFKKHKIIPSVADGIAAGLTPKYTNYIDNLAAEWMGIARLDSMTTLRDELLERGQGVYIDDMMEAPADWRAVHDPVFDGYRLTPEVAKLIDNLISTNKVSKYKPLRALRAVNNALRMFKFLGSAYHLLIEAKVSLADSGFLGFLLPRKTTFRGGTRGFGKKDDRIFRTPEYKDYIALGGGHRYSHEAEARQMMDDMVDFLKEGRLLGLVGKVAGVPLRIPRTFVDWMFEQYIPKLKYAKYLDTVAGRERKFGRDLYDWEKIEIIKEGQNFYGEMNERLFGRSGTATSVLRFFLLAPSFAEGDYRSILKALFQHGFGVSIGPGVGVKRLETAGAEGEGWKATRSRVNIVNSLLLTAIGSTIGTLIFARRWPKKPETAEDVRDLLKIDTGKVDEDGNPIMIDLLTYDKDYWEILFNVVRGRPDKAVYESIRRLGGMKSPMFEMALDFGKMAVGEAIYDWKGDRVTEITDSWTEKLLKIAVHELEKTEPISVSVFEQARAKHVDKILSFVQAVAGVRVTTSEKVIRERKILQRCWSLKGQREELYISLASLDDPRAAVKWYNDKVVDVLEGPLVPEELRAEWTEELTIDLEKYLEIRAADASIDARTDDSRRRAERAAAVLRAFKIGPDEAIALRRRWRNRQRMESLGKPPANPLESQPLIGDMIKENRLRERLGERKEERSKGDIKP